MNLVALQEGALELVQDEFEDLLVGALRIILAVLDIVGDEAQVSSDELRHRGGLVILGELVCGRRQAGAEALFQL